MTYVDQGYLILVFSTKYPQNIHRGGMALLSDYIDILDPKRVDKNPFLWYSIVTLKSGYFDGTVFALPNASSLGGRKRRV